MFWVNIVLMLIMKFHSLADEAKIFYKNLDWFSLNVTLVDWVKLDPAKQ